MSNQIGKNPLGYTGVRATRPPQVIVADRAPTAADFRDVEIGDLWVDQSVPNTYQLGDVASGAASWVQTN